MKRFSSLIITLIFTLTTLTSCSFKHFSFDDSKENGDKTNDNEFITRADWAKLLGTYFGMDSCLDATPLFNDLTASDAAFPYVQSCAEWGVISVEEDLFNPTEYATAEFAVETAVLAAESDYSSYGSTFDYALNCNAISGDKNDYITYETASNIVEWALEEYNNHEFVEYENIEYKDELISMPEIDADEDGTIVIKADNNSYNDIKVDDVVITAPTASEPYGVARKITSISVNEDGERIIETVEPEIGDVFDELEFAHVGTVTDPDTIQTVEGVTLTELTPTTLAAAVEGPEIVQLVNTNGTTPKVQKLADKSVNLGFSVKLASDGKVSCSPSYNSLKAEVEKSGDEEESELFDKTGLTKQEGLKKDSDEETVKPVEKYSSGWEIEGSISLKNFYIETELKTKKAFGVPYGIKNYGYEINYEAASSLKFTGKIDDEITLATVPIPLGGTGITLDVEFSVKTSLSGDIEVSASVSSKSTVEYSEKSGYKKTQSTQSESGIKISGNFKTGVGCKATLKVVGVKLIDFKLDIGIKLEVSAKLTRVMQYENGIYKYDKGIADLKKLGEKVMLCTDCILVYPTASLSLGTSKGTLANKLGIKLTWKIMDKSGATCKSEIDSIHYELGKGLVDECSIDTYEAISEEDVSSALEQDKQENADKVGSDVMDISCYAMSLAPEETADLSVTTLPYGHTGYEIRWESSDESVVEIDDAKATETGASCKIKAKTPGSTMIVISTVGGDYQLKCAITVSDNGNVEYNPID